MSISTGHRIDRICTLDFHPGSGHLGSNIEALYQEALDVQGAPLTYLAAKGLIDTVSEGDTVFVITGTGIDKWCPAGETDGPVGCAALARGLTRALGAKVVAICEDEMAVPMKATLMAAGEYVFNEEMFFDMPSSVVTFEPFPLGPEKAREIAEELVKKYQPKAMIFVERLGPNEAGVYHFVTGTVNPPEGMSYGHHLVDAAKENGIFTIGIGDGGNEIGFGKIHSKVQEIVEVGRTCKCPCGKGMATVTDTDVLIAASISNWGAYGIVAMLAYFKNDLNILHDEETEYRMIEACALNGCLDGLFIKPILSVDGVPVSGNQAIVTLLRETVKKALMHYERAF